ncbi:hypothetical protein [Clostridium sp.]|uniref:hypothetical protein n=1 Tax=Clostridium sp. TaxID=1506 RepID=UPI0035A17122
MSNTDKLLQQILDSQNKTNERLNNLESQTSENTQILKALVHSSEVHKAQTDKLTYDVAQISGDVKSIKSAVVKGQKAYDYLENFNKFSSEE